MKLFKNLLCNLGFHQWEQTDDIFSVNHPFAMFSEKCTNCNKKSLLRCANFGWAGREKNREIVDNFGEKYHYIKHNGKVIDNE